MDFRNRNLMRKKSHNLRIFFQRNKYEIMQITLH